MVLAVNQLSRHQPGQRESRIEACGEIASIIVMAATALT